MTVQTVRPNGTNVNSFGLVGGASAHAVTSDNSDSSYAEAIYPGYSEMRIDFDSISLSGTQFIRQVRIRVRWATTPQGAITLWYVRFMDALGNVSSTDTYQTTSSGTIVESSGGWKTSAPDGSAWSLTDVDNLQIQVFPGLYTGNVQMPRIYELYIDVDVNTNPVATVTAPANGSTINSTSRPITTFTYNDADADSMEAYRVKIFSSAQYTALGFDPNTASATFDTGKVFASAPPLNGIIPTVDLTNLGTYRSYVWVYQIGGPSGTTGNGVSTPSYTQYTIDIVAPPTPNITAAADQPNERVILTITPNVAAASNRTLAIQRSANSGVDWDYIRGGKIYPNTGSPLTVYDYEMPPNLGVVYRVRNVETIGSVVLAGDWSTTSSPTVTVTTQDYVLKDPLDPSRNLVLNVLGNSVDENSPEDVAFFNPVGRAFKVAIADRVKGVESVLELDFTSEAEYQLFELLRESGRVLLLVRGWTNEQWYIRFGQVLKKTLYNYNPPYRTVTIPWTEVEHSPTAPLLPLSILSTDDFGYGGY